MRLAFFPGPAQLSVLQGQKAGNEARVRHGGIEEGG